MKNYENMIWEELSKPLNRTKTSVFKAHLFAYLSEE